MDLQKQEKPNLCGNMMEMNINYNNKRFRPIENTDNGETSDDTIFHYIQEDDIITSIYSGGDIVKGQLIGKVDINGNIKMNYQQINNKGHIRTGECISKPEILSNGKIRLHENWKWTSGDKSEGNSIIEEI